MANNLMKASAFGLTAILASFTAGDMNAQKTIDGKVGVVSTAVPFLKIGPDARSGGMGDVGIALSPDANAQYWNIGKVAASDKEAGASITYTPWLRNLVDDVFLAYISGYMKVGENKDQAISASMRYFSLGDINYTDIAAMPIGSGKPREMALDVGYSRLLSPEFSLGINLRYIYSNIAAGSVDPNNAYSAASAFATDLGFHYSKTKEQDAYKSETFAAGLVLSNLGSKITYTETERDFLPSQLGLGLAYTKQMDMYSKFTVALDLVKATTPAPINKTIYDNSGASIGSKWDRQLGKSVMQGFFSSFGTAPPGYGTSVAIGGEYWYQDQFAARAGYFYEAKGNGGRQYFTVGLGVKYSVFGLNFSYLVQQGNSLAQNPLANTLRFSLLFDFDKETLEEGKRNRKKASRNKEEASKNRMQPSNNRDLEIKTR